MMDADTRSSFLMVDERDQPNILPARNTVRLVLRNGERATVPAGGLVWSIETSLGSSKVALLNTFREADCPTVPVLGASGVLPSVGCELGRCLLERHATPRPILRVRSSMDSGVYVSSAGGTFRLPVIGFGSPGKVSYISC